MQIKIIMSLFFLIFLSASNVNSEENFKNYKKYSFTKTKFKLDVVAKELNHPWALTFIDNKHLVVTEKSGGVYKININIKFIVIKHEIKHIGYDGGSISYSQGGLLDAHFNNQDGYIYFTYSHDFKGLQVDGKSRKDSSTAIARGRLSNNQIIDLEILLIAEPKLQTNKHFGSRLSIKNGMLFASFGERDKGMISQDPTKHPGSIIRIKTNGDIPKDNPKFNGKETWLPEIYTIGVRNPQGLTLSPYDGFVYSHEHGPRGGDELNAINPGKNYGWPSITYGIDYNGSIISPFKRKDGMEQPLKYWVPSIAPSDMTFYNKTLFPKEFGSLDFSQGIINLKHRKL